MKLLIVILGIVLILFGFYPPFQLMSIAIGIVVTIIGMLIKSKKKEPKIGY
jgi:hypothetical protein